MNLKVKKYSNKVKILETKLNVLEALYEKHSNSLSTDTLISMESEKTEILKELFTITAEAFAAMNAENTRAN